jgi:hypothetical protein
VDQIEVKWLKRETGGLIQAYSIGMQYCFLSDDLRQCHSFVYCKDFLQDARHAFLHKQRAEIYGFSYGPRNKPICTSRTKIAITNTSDPDFGEKMPNMIDFVNQFARLLHLKQTEVFQVKSVPRKYERCGVFVTDGSPRWMNSPPLLSMYSLLLRCGCGHRVGDKCFTTIDRIISGKVKSYGGEDDSIQLKDALPGIKKIVKLGYRPFFYIDDAKNYPKDVSIDDMHDRTGIVAFSVGDSEDVCPYWHRESLYKRLETSK